MSVQSSLVMYPISQYGTEEQKQRYLPPLGIIHIRRESVCERGKIYIPNIFHKIEVYLLLNVSSW